jgi:hypothetical protein
MFKITAPLLRLIIALTVTIGFAVPGLALKPGWDLNTTNPAMKSESFRGKDYHSYSLPLGHNFYKYENDIYKTLYNGLSRITVFAGIQKSAPDISKIKINLFGNTSEKDSDFASHVHKVVEAMNNKNLSRVEYEEAKNPHNNALLTVDFIFRYNVSQDDKKKLFYEPHEMGSNILYFLGLVATEFHLPSAVLEYLASELELEGMLGYSRSTYLSALRDYLQENDRLHAKVAKENDDLLMTKQAELEKADVADLQSEVRGEKDGPKTPPPAEVLMYVVNLRQELRRLESMHYYSWELGNFDIDGRIAQLKKELRIEDERIGREKKEWRKLMQRLEDERRQEERRQEQARREKQRRQEEESRSQPNYN